MLLFPFILQFPFFIFSHFHFPPRVTFLFILLFAFSCSAKEAFSINGEFGHQALAHKQFFKCIAYKLT